MMRVVEHPAKARLLLAMHVCAVVVLAIVPTTIESELFGPLWLLIILMVTGVTTAMFCRYVAPWSTRRWFVSVLSINGATGLTMAIWLTPDTIPRSREYTSLFAATFAISTVALSLFTLLVRWMSYNRIQWRRNLGCYCEACSYDLKGNESGVCPKCGTPVNNAEVSAGTSADDHAIPPSD